MTELNDSLLIEKTLSGDDYAFSLLVKVWREKLYRFAYRYMHNADDAHDVVQQTFIKVHRNLESLDNPERFSPWIYKITLNLCRDELRRKTRSSQIFVSEDSTDIHAPEFVSQTTHSQNHAFERQEIIDRALRYLSDEQKTVLLMKEFQGLKFREIAEVLDISENTAKSRLYYALKAMHKTFEKMNINREELL